MKLTQKRMSRLFTVLFLMLCFANAQSQYIAEVLEYKPAPGQFINDPNWGTPTSANSIMGGLDGKLSLGAFGGYVVFRFAESVENHPDNPYGVDLTIFGNAIQALSEPGIVYVMKDENQNGIPDDTWYELAGSDHHFSSTIKDYEVTYSNPHQSVAADVPWTDNIGGAGFIYANSVHTQPYYPLHDSFPEINQDQYTLKGSRINLPKDSLQGGIIRLPERAFGYADNKPREKAPYTLPDNPYTIEPENSGGDAFDIGWAIDSLGNTANLDKIDFIKIQSAAMQDGGWLGEASTEITGAVDIPPNAGIQGIEDMIVIKDLPLILDTNHLQLEVFVFHKGHLQPGKEVQFSINMNDATIDENHLLSVQASGELEITATLVENPEISTSISTSVELPSSISEITRKEISIYPNPANNQIVLKNIREADIRVYDLQGRLFKQISNYQDNDIIDLNGVPSGLYIINVQTENKVQTLKLIKQ